MNESSTENGQPAADDPRFGFAMVTEAVGGLIETAEAMELGHHAPVLLQLAGWMGREVNG